MERRGASSCQERGSIGWGGRECTQEPQGVCAGVFGPESGESRKIALGLCCLRIPAYFEQNAALECGAKQTNPRGQRSGMSVMRTVLLAASQNRWLRERAANYGFVRRSVSRFMPGETLDDALNAAATLKTKKIGAVFTHLGENVADRNEAQRVADHYL